MSDEFVPESWDRFQEAVALSGGFEVSDDTAYTPESLEAQLEWVPVAADELLHLEDPLREAMLDEGGMLEGFDAEDVDLALEEQDDDWS